MSMFMYNSYAYELRSNNYLFVLFLNIASNHFLLEKTCCYCFQLCVAQGSTPLIFISRRDSGLEWPRQKSRFRLMAITC